MCNSVWTLPASRSIQPRIYNIIRTRRQATVRRCLLQRHRAPATASRAIQLCGHCCCCCCWRGRRQGHGAWCMAPTARCQALNIIRRDGLYQTPTVAADQADKQQTQDWSPSVVARQQCIQRIASSRTANHSSHFIRSTTIFIRATLCCHRVSVCLSVRHKPVLY